MVTKTRILSELGLDMCTECPIRFNCQIVISEESPRFTRDRNDAIKVSLSYRWPVEMKNILSLCTGDPDKVQCLKKPVGFNNYVINHYNVLSILGCYGDGFVSVEDWRY